jgi:glyoxylase-like metal-dependent hydrolase (beta-lactamase superfamily II)
VAVDRRVLLQGAAGGLAAAIAAQWPRPAAAAGGLQIDPVGNGVWLIGGAGGNVLAVATDAGAIAVDSGANASSDAIVATLTELPAGPVAALFNTHWHTDQVGANAALGAAGATIYAHEKTRQRLANGYYLRDEDRYEAPLPAVALPTETFFDNGSASIGGVDVDYGYLIEAHTDGDIFVHFRDANVIAAGDVVSPVKDPVFDWFGGGWLGGRVDALAALLDRTDSATRFVPAYGPVVGRADVQAEHDMLLELFERMVEHVRLGEAAEDMLEAGVLDGLGREFDDPYRLLYDMHKGFWAHHNKLMPDIV